MLMLDLNMHDVNQIHLQFELILSCKMIKRSLNGTWINIKNSTLCMEQEHEVEFKDVQSIHDESCEFIDPCKFKLGDTIFELDQVYMQDEEMQNLIYSILPYNDWFISNQADDNWEVS